MPFPSRASVERPTRPETAIGHDGVTVDTEWGSVKVEEGVTSNGDRDLYTYTATNVSFVCAGCGICKFYVPNLHSFPTLAPGGTATFSTTLNLGAPPPPFPVVVSVEADCVLKVRECDETNNAAAFTVREGNACR